MDSLRIHGKLQPGHQGSFFIDLDPNDKNNWVRRTARDMPARFQKIWVLRMKVGITTAVGKTFWKPIENNLQEKLLEATEE
jgi:hypothetical protein